MHILDTVVRNVQGNIGVRAAHAAQRAETLCRRVQGKGWNGGSVRAEVRAILSLLPASDAVVLDVGAHRGEWTRALLELAASRINKIWAFEPGSANLEALSTLPRDKVEVVTQAVSNTLGSAQLIADAPGSQLASLHRRRLDHFGLTVSELGTVSTITLDTFATRKDISTIDLLKMDIEGHELYALQGAAGLLEQGRIRALTFEFGGCNIDSRTYFQDFWYLLTGYGFRLHRLLPSAGLLPIQRYTEDLETFVTTNYAAILGREHAEDVR
jgi:FkbM family methyltransferase